MTYYFTFSRSVPCLQTTGDKRRSKSTAPILPAPIRKPSNSPHTSDPPGSPCSGSRGNSAWAVVDVHTLAPLCGHRLQAGLLGAVATAQCRAEGGWSTAEPTPIPVPKSSCLDLPHLLYI